MSRIGLTYDLKDDYLKQGFAPETVAEFDKLETIQAIEIALQGLGYRTERIGNLESLMVKLLSGDRWDLVFNIAEGVSGYGRESQIPAILDAYGIPFTFSDALTLAVTLHKATAKRIVRDAGVPTADFTVVESEHDARRVTLPLPLFVKPIAEGSSKGVTSRSIIRRRRDLAPVCGDLLRTYGQPILVEAFLPGREFTVGMLGSGDQARVLGVMEILVGGAGEKAYSLAVKSADDFRSLVSYRLCPDADLAATCASVALAAWRVLGCRDAGRVDLRCDAEGRPAFMEVNPLAGLHPEDSDLIILGNLVDVPHFEIIRSIMMSAEQRALPAREERSVSARR